MRADLSTEVIDRVGGAADHSAVGEYVLITAMVATLAIGLASIPDSELATRLPVTNARAYLALQEERGSFDAFVWAFVGGKPKQNAWASLREIPASTPESDALSRELKRRGFKFVGSTICYAFMQAAGLVNDHLTGCFRYREVKRLAG